MGANLILRLSPKLDSRPCSKVAQAERNTCDSKGNLWAFCVGFKMVIGGQIHFCALGAHTPTAHTATISRFLCLFVQTFPLNFFVSTIQQIIWLSLGTYCDKSTNPQGPGTSTKRSKIAFGGHIYCARLGQIVVASRSVSNWESRYPRPTHIRYRTPCCWSVCFWKKIECVTRPEL